MLHIIAIFYSHYHYHYCHHNHSHCDYDYHHDDYIWLLYPLMMMMMMMVGIQCWEIFPLTKFLGGMDCAAVRRRGSGWCLASLATKEPGQHIFRHHHDGLGMGGVKTCQIIWKKYDSNGCLGCCTCLDASLCFYRLTPLHDGTWPACRCRWCVWASYVLGVPNFDQMHLNWCAGICHVRTPGAMAKGTQRMDGSNESAWT